jgi:putative inorganic carbon (HCO3(-)) transporter
MPIIHLGLEGYVGYVLYSVAIAAFLLSVFWRPIIGIYYLILLIPLQTVRYRLNEFPLGPSLLGIMLIGVAVGVLRSGHPVFPSSSWKRFVAIFGGFTFVSLCLGSVYLGTSIPLPGDARFNYWQEYMVMPALLLLTAAVLRTKREIQIALLVMCFATLLLNKSFWNEVSDRDFSTYSEELHEDGGSMGYAGANGLATFTAQVATFLLALAGFERRKWLSAGYYGLAAFSAICLMYSLSRGGYAAFLAGCLVIGVLKQRKLLLLLGVFLLTWTTIVPPAVEQRVDMTYDEESGDLDNSAKTRLSLWSSAQEVFNANMVFGTGFDTYRFMHLNKRTDSRAGYYADTHNYFVKVLVETGIVGLALFFWLLVKLLGDGFRLFRYGDDPLFRSLGLGIVGWIVCAVVANLFGDRWTFLQVNGYMWVIAGMNCRASELIKTAASVTATVASPVVLNSANVQPARGRLAAQARVKASESSWVPRHT